MDDEAADSGPITWQPTAPDGSVGLVTVQPADHGSFWFSTPWQSYARLTGDTSWWVDVEIVGYPYTVVREAHPTKEVALRRASQLRVQFLAGQLSRRYPPLFRRRFRSTGAGR